jgi:microsomal dipeptidase-like Zn-dependent dipeptidase
MNMQNIIVDLHCHPAMKPYGRSFDNPTLARQNTLDTSDRSSIWYYDPPSVSDKLFNYVFGLTKFRQSDLTSSLYGQVKVISASLYPIEKGFVNNNVGSGVLSDSAVNLATGLGFHRVNHLQTMGDYFADLQDEYDFYRQLNGQVVTIDNKKARYVLVKNFLELETLASNPLPDVETIAIFFSIEGAHVLNCGLDPQNKPAQRKEVLDNLDKIKQWPHPPFFITVAHHFYNELCGHAPSLSGFMARVMDQTYKMNEGFTQLGWDVIESMLSTHNGARILVDLKHMSPRSRKEYMNYLKDHRLDDVPLIVSHGAANGMYSDETKRINNKSTGHLLNPVSINFYDDELIRIAMSQGIFGLQVDERRAGSREALRQARGRLERRKILFHRSKLIWNQIQHIAEVLAEAGAYPWSIQAIGSDYDGIVDPINGYWTHEDLQFLDDYLLMHAYNYMQGEGKKLRTGNTVDPEEIVSRVMHLNAMEFLKRNF